MRESDIPATFGGTARFQVANALAAAAATRALGVPAAVVRQGLAAFGTVPDHNPGRMNLFEVGGGHVLMDYGHNPAALDAVAMLVSRANRRVTAVVAAPGDRPDELIRECGRAAAQGFDRLVIKEDADLRGRVPGEVALLLLAGAKEEDPEAECEVVRDEAEAVRTALRELGDGELVVVFYDDQDAVKEVLAEFGAVPAAGLSWLIAAEQQEARPVAVG